MSKLTSFVKPLFLKMGFYYLFNFIWNIPRIIKWIQLGCKANAPHPVKMAIIQSYLKEFKLRTFVETGTFMGDTLGFIAASGCTSYSIELSEEFYKNALERFRGQSNVNLILGDSGEQLPILISDLKEPALFWLDGHYSAGNTASADQHTPVSKEVSAVLDHPVKGHVILIDDARCFDGTNNYPFLEDLLLFIRKDGHYLAEVSTDIIRLTPKNNLSSQR
uniref:hypothetical protein n=1 Tax=Algoriphagus sp. TaxID=1872435 RepID=UPI0040473770